MDERKLVISVTYENAPYKLNLMDEIKIDKDDLQAAFLDQAGKYSWYAVISADARARLEMAKHELEVKRAEVAHAFRVQSEAMKKKTTEKGVEEHVVLDQEVRAIMEAMLNARKELELVSAAEKAFVHRRDMLIQLGAMERVERKESQYASQP